MTDIKQMGGTQESLEQEGDTSRIRGRVPASEIAGYQQTLVSYTSGTGRLTCTPAGYSPCHDAERVIEESGYDPERDTDNPADSVFVSHGGSDIVKWDEVPEHMHIGSVLRRYRNAGGGEGAGGASGYEPGSAYGSAADRMISGMSDSEARKRQLAAEKELRQIFERTYGPSKDRTGRAARESRFGSEYEMPEKTEEQKAADELRNQQIREKHEKKKVQAAPEERPVVLIDGYNLIHADEYLTDLAKKDMGGARDQILERLCNYAAYTGTETVVVFDAYNVTGGEGYEEDHLGVRVIFTSENEPADIRIGLMTNAMKNRRIYVVSSDVLVQQDSFEHGALRISSREFMRLLEQTEEEIRSSL
jgi:predicted RNA-binding protein with PIN domain